jgi:hypothetical protein
MVPERSASAKAAEATKISARESAAGRPKRSRVTPSCGIGAVEDPKATVALLIVSSSDYNFHRTVRRFVLGTR